MTESINQHPYTLTLWIVVGMLAMVFVPAFLLAFRTRHRENAPPLWAMAGLAFGLPLLVGVPGWWWVQAARADFDTITDTGTELVFHHSMTGAEHRAPRSAVVSVEISVESESGHGRSDTDYFVVVRLADGTSLESERGNVVELLERPLERLGLPSPGSGSPDPR